MTQNPTYDYRSMEKVEKNTDISILN